MNRFKGRRKTGADDPCEPGEWCQALARAGGERQARGFPYDPHRSIQFVVFN
ncbi:MULTISPECIES: hypothetical protein [Cupriavidus]|uniref:hypothetical protein n=1 Tax=Cupriavidus TaxID=106589 RepID=UPI0003AA8E97|nr:MULTISPECIES: hypothetical protein [Cupriavidus]